MICAKRPLWEQTETANLRSHLFLSLHVESTKHFSSLIYPPVHEEEKVNSSHASADDNEDHDDNDDDDCMSRVRGGDCRRLWQQESSLPSIPIKSF
jgi:hypothetical protein